MEEMVEEMVEEMEEEMGEEIASSFGPDTFLHTLLFDSFFH